MARKVALAPAAVQRAEPLPARYWTQLEDMRVPGREDRIARVLVGPSGVHVVTDVAGQPDPVSTVTAAGPDLEASAQRAAAVAADVAGLLPLRYRHVVTAELCLTGLTATATSVGPVVAGSPDMLDQAWRNRRRVVSTSEAAVLVRMLGDRLEPFPEPVAPRRARWWRRWPRRWVVGGAAALTGAAAGGVVAVAELGVPGPWGLW